MSEMEPWRMWGNTMMVELVQTVIGANPPVFSGQLVNVRYARPESWNFFFHAKLISTITDDATGVDVKFNVTQGIGRSHVTILGFEHFTFAWGTLLEFPVVSAFPAYSTSVKAPNRNIRYTPITDNLPDEINAIVAQDIQINVAAFTSGTDLLGNVVKLEVSAFIAPKTHIRPEWFERIGKFRAGENKGF